MNHQAISAPFYDLNNIPWEPVENGISRKILTLNQIMFVFYQLPAGLVTDAQHCHPHEQMAYILSGRIRMIVGSEEKVLGPGCGYLANSGVKHHLEVLEDTIILDGFSPPREDFLTSNNK